MVLDGRWRLVTMDVDGDVVEAGDHVVTLEVAEGRVSGRGGVNRYMGSLTGGPDTERIELSPLATTLMAGPPDAMALEATYLRLIGAIDQADVSGDHLVVAGPQGRATFRALTAEEAWLDDHPGWRLDDGALVSDRSFADFAAAIDFVNRVAVAAEAADHHPDLAISWNRVTITLRTHDAGGAVTDLDRSLAATIDGL